MRITAPEYWLHPEGTFPAQLVTFEEGTGQYGVRIKWVWETNVERDDDKPPQLAYYTSESASAKSKLGQMMEGMGIALPTGGEELDPNDWIGTRCRIKVVHDESADGRTWANIEKFLPIRAQQAAPKPAPKPAEKALEAEEEGGDIFADEQEAAA